MDLLPGLLCVALTFLTTSTGASDVSRCPTNLPRNRYLKASSWDICYQFRMEERPWRTANNICKRLGGRMVTIKEWRIQKFLISSLSSLNWPRKGLWIGANDKESEMDWRWVTGEKVRNGYSNWASGQPSCGLLCFEDCALMRWRERGGQWHDYRCNWLEDYSFICEFAMLPPTTTSTTKTTTTMTTTTKKTTTATTSTTSTTTKNTSTPKIKVTKKLESDNLLNGTNQSKQTVYPYGSNRLRHGQVKEIESQSGGLTSGSLIGLVVGILIGLSCAVCFIFFILLRRRKRKQSIEEDPQLRYNNPYYAEAPNLLYAVDACRSEGDGTIRTGDTNDDIGSASGGYEEAVKYLPRPQKCNIYDSHKEETVKLKLPPPPSPLHSKPKLVLNKYDTPPILAPVRLGSGADDTANRKSRNVAGGNNGNNKGRGNSGTLTDKENYYSEVHSRPTSYTYDIPASHNNCNYASNNGATAVVNDDNSDFDGYTENDYYNEAENLYESLENLTGAATDAEEKVNLMSPPTLPKERVENEFQVEDMYVNGVKENVYIPLKTDQNIYY